MNPAELEETSAPALEQGAAMETHHTEAIGRRCRLIVPVRDHQGRIQFEERPTIVSEIHNLGRHMFLARFADGAYMYLFQHEIRLEDDS
jgi:hypothetical protein